jgi:hypothetical protein
VGVGELFDTLLVFDNNPVDRSGLSVDAGSLRLTNVLAHHATLCGCAAQSHGCIDQFTRNSACEPSGFRSSREHDHLESNISEH